jgi:hypothetical protein
MEKKIHFLSILSIEQQQQKGKKEMICKALPTGIEETLFIGIKKRRRRRRDWTLILTACCSFLIHKIFHSLLLLLLLPFSN